MFIGVTNDYTFRARYVSTTCRGQGSIIVVAPVCILEHQIHIACVHVFFDEMYLCKHWRIKSIEQKNTDVHTEVMPQTSIIRAQYSSSRST